MTAGYLPLVANVRRVDDHARIIRKRDGDGGRLLGGILGDEGEKPEVEVPEALAGANAFAAAVAARLSAHDSEVARKAADFLIDQSHLLKIQSEYLGDEYWRWTAVYL
jgi:hypothetical protein